MDARIVQVGPAVFGSASTSILGLQIGYESLPWFVGNDHFTYTVEATLTGEQWTETVNVTILGSDAVIGSFSE